MTATMNSHTPTPTTHRDPTTPPHAIRHTPTPASTHTIRRARRSRSQEAATPEASRRLSPPARGEMINVVFLTPAPDCPRHRTRCTWERRRCSRFDVLLPCLSLVAASARRGRGPPWSAAPSQGLREAGHERRITRFDPHEHEQLHDGSGWGSPRVGAGTTERRCRAAVHAPVAVRAVTGSRTRQANDQKVRDFAPPPTRNGAAHLPKQCPIREERDATSLSWRASSTASPPDLITLEVGRFQLGPPEGGRGRGWCV